MYVFPFIHCCHYPFNFFLPISFLPGMCLKFTLLPLPGLFSFWVSMLLQSQLIQLPIRKFANPIGNHSSCLSTRCFKTKANNADKILAKTVLHQIIICPPNKGGKISINTSIKTGSIKVSI